MFFRFRVCGLFCSWAVGFEGFEGLFRSALSIFEIWGFGASGLQRLGLRACVGLTVFRFRAEASDAGCVVEGLGFRVQGLGRV